MIHSRLIPRRYTGAGKIIRVANGKAPILFALALTILLLPVYGISQVEWDGRTQVPVHDADQYCNTCPVILPIKNTNIGQGSIGKYSLLCKYSDPRKFVHPVDIAPWAALVATMPRQLPLDSVGGNCPADHEMHRHCRQRPLESDSARGTRDPGRLSFSFRCHDGSVYEAYNQHIQEEQHA